MAKQTCAKCGKEKDVYGAKVCPNDHFICKDCTWQHISCPLCNKPLKYRVQKLEIRLSPIAFIIYRDTEGQLIR